MYRLHLCSSVANPLLTLHAQPIAVYKAFPDTSPSAQSPAPLKSARKYYHYHPADWPAPPTSPPPYSNPPHSPSTPQSPTSPPPHEAHPKPAPRHPHSTSPNLQ